MSEKCVGCGKVMTFEVAFPEDEDGNIQGIQVVWLCSECSRFATFSPMTKAGEILTSPNGDVTVLSYDHYDHCEKCGAKTAPAFTPSQFGLLNVNVCEMCGHWTERNE